MKRTIAAALAAFLLAGCQPEAQRPEAPVEAKDDTLYGDEVFVLARRGMGGKLTDHATWNFAYEARQFCGVRFEVESGQDWSEWIFKPTHRAQRAKLVVFVGTSLGGFVAREHAQRWSYDGNGSRVRLLLIDTVPWTNPIPKNVGADHVVWRNTLFFDLGGGRPEGTIEDDQHDRTSRLPHGLLIHSPQTRKEVVTEICRGITHPSKRGKQ